MKSRAKVILSVSFITLISRVLGLLREMLKARVLGTSIYSDAFTLAFSLPNLFRRLTAEGIMSTAFIPVFLQEKEKGTEKAFAFAVAFFWLFLAILVVFAGLFIIAMPWLIRYVFATGFEEQTMQITILLSRLMFGYIVFVSLSAICQAVLNSLSIFHVSALMPCVLNITIISFVLLFQDVLPHPVYAFAFAVLLGGSLQLFLQIPSLRKQGFSLLRKFSWRNAKLKEVFTLMLPAIFGIGIYQINIIVGQVIASHLAAGSLSSLAFSNRLLELVLGVLVVSVTTIYMPQFTTLFIKKEYQRISFHIQDIFNILRFVCVPATIFTLFYRNEIVGVLFLRGAFNERSLQMTSDALLFHILGLLFIAYSRVFITAYQAAKKVNVVVMISLVVLIVNLVAAFALSRHLGHVGIAQANSISQVVQVTLLYIYLSKLSLQRDYKLLFDSGWFKVIAVNLVFALCLWLSKQLSLHLEITRLFSLLIGFGIGFISFLFACVIFKVNELKQLTLLLQSKQKK